MASSGNSATNTLPSRQRSLRQRPSEVEQLGQFRTFDADGRRVVVALLKEPWDELLQLAGDGLLIALAQSVRESPTWPGAAPA